MKYFVDLNKTKSNEGYWTYPKEGTVLKIEGKSYIVREFDHGSSDAGFGWVWLYHEETQTYPFKMSIFDRRSIPGSTEVPHVGLTNQDAYNAVHRTVTSEHGVLFSWSNIWRLIRGLFS
jgi:hypothetical protein